MRNAIRGQQGITFLSFIIVLVVVGFFAYMAMRLFPIYQENFSVRSAMKGVAEEVGPNTPPSQIRNLLSRRFDISYVTSVRPQDIRVVRDSQGTRMTVRYERRAQFIHNIEFLVTFDESVELTGGRLATAN